ncbi:hypothetical protein [Brachybacterium saurashtrense]|uniref:Uncharacterized protein n=1 Tax=Brachybacterium saurashtrense TaxID=556288 RepID=A0A345YQ61_9MICO|nr:hypothetical protein [Brachybacterium saurashtrense]AXK46063.1 hypothetical protein DWV08_10880 [Brachybacterium saurashtrense]RRR23803.1 hypothetical protein DXU92_02630 [Brachybacterium saurashtrense]
MSALPSDPSSAADSVPGQDETHHRVRQVLTAVLEELRARHPGLGEFQDHRPARDRSSGDSWQGLQTLCHVSALLVGRGLPDPAEAAGVIDAVHRAASAHGLHPRAENAGRGMTVVSWAGEEGDLLELVLGVRVAVRMVSAPFLPGSLAPVPSTSPAAVLSPRTPPPRLVR